MPEDSKQITEYSQPLSVQLTRGAKGIYQWEMKYRGVTPDECRKVLKLMDEQLRCDYLGAGVEPGAVEPPDQLL